MAQKTVTRADLAEAVYESVGLSQTKSAELVERVLDMIGDALVKGENVKLSSFGSFQVRSKNERIGRNPKTGEEVPILSSQVSFAMLRVGSFRSLHASSSRCSSASETRRSRRRSAFAGIRRREDETPSW